MTKSNAQADPPSTETRIIGAAGDLIAEEGWAALTTRAVATRAEVNKALVHYHFGSVEALGLAALRRAFDAEVAEAMTVVLDHDELADGLRAFGRWLRDRAEGAGLRRVIVEGLSQATLHVELRDFLVAGLEGLRKELVARTPESLGATATPLASALAATLDGIVIHDLVDPGFDPAEALDALADLMDRAAAVGGA